MMNSWTTGGDYLALKRFIVEAIPSRQKAMEASTKVSRRSGICASSSGEKRPEDVVYLCALWEVIPDTEAQTGIGLRAEELGDILQPIVTSVTSLALEAERPEGQSEVVNDDQHALNGDLLRAHPVADSFATEVHSR